MVLQDLLIFVIVSFGAGTLGSMLGLGGGFIIVPALAFMGFRPSEIASTSLFAVFSTSVSSTLAYMSQKTIDYSLGTRFALISIPGAIIGAYVSDYITIQPFKLYFALVLIGTSLYILRGSVFSKAHQTQRTHSVMALCYTASFIAGILSSLFGVGGGVIFVPMMVALLGMSMYVSAPTSQFIVLITSVAGLASHVALGHPDYLQALILAVGAFAGAQLGAKISTFIKEKLLQKLVSIALFGVAARFIVDFLHG